MMAFVQELRQAARSLQRAPTVTLAAVLCLALGIGATTAVSSAISRALLQPPPFRDPDRLVAVHRVTPQSGPQGTWPQSAPNYVDLARETRLIQGLAAMAQGAALVQLPKEAVQASRLSVTGNLFATLGVAAERGRLIGVDDDRLDAPLVAVLSHGFWTTHLGADPAVLGQTITIDGQPATVIGIAPFDFRIPHGTNVLRADVWTPMRFTPNNLAQRRSNYLQLLGRLAPGATPQSAQAELRTLFSGLVLTYPQLRGEDVRVAPLQGENVRSVRTPLLLLFGAVCMVLLIAVTNVAALLLARGVQRRREMAVRSALGATRWAAMQPALAESLLITGIGVTFGIALAFGGVHTIGALAAARMRQLEGLHIDFSVVVFAIGLALIAAVACGAVPAWRGATVDPQDALRGGRGGGAGREHQRALRSLVVLEISLSLVLLIGAGLVMKGFAGLLRNDPGFEPSRILTMRVSTSGAEYPDQTSVRAFLEPALAAIRAIPGVDAAGAINVVPYVNWGWNGNTRYEGQPADDPTRLPITEQRTVAPEFFDVTQQRLIAGRRLLPSDERGDNPHWVVVVNQALVERDFKGRDPIGQRFYLGDSPGDTTMGTIVGVVTNIRNAGPFAPPQPEMYWSYRQSSPGASDFPLLVRVRSGDPAAVFAAVRSAIHNLDPTSAIGDVRTMPDVIALSLGRPRFYLSLLGSFAAVALLLAVAGLYGVLAYAVAQRTREIGIRVALGSSRRALVQLVTLEGLRLVGLGLALGFAGGAALTRLMTFMLYGVSPLDRVTWTAAGAILFAASMAAAIVPALRASRVNPMIAMQAE
jgi:putative ABC transport system permease protein